MLNGASPAVSSSHVWAFDVCSNMACHCVYSNNFPLTLCFYCVLSLSFNQLHPIYLNSINSKPVSEQGHGLGFAVVLPLHISLWSCNQSSSTSGVCLIYACRWVGQICCLATSNKLGYETLRLSLSSVVFHYIYWWPWTSYSTNRHKNIVHILLTKKYRPNDVHSTN